MSGQLAFGFAAPRVVYMNGDPGYPLEESLAEAVARLCDELPWSRDGYSTVVLCRDGMFRAYAGMGCEWGWWRDSGHREAVHVRHDASSGSLSIDAYRDSGGCGWMWSCNLTGKARRLLQAAIRARVTAMEGPP